MNEQLVNDLISTHSLTKRLTVTGKPVLSVQIYFNSQPHEEADDDLLGGLFDEDISTHSLTKRLTITVQFLIFHMIFQLTASRRG